MIHQVSAYGFYLNMKIVPGSMDNSCVGTSSQ